MPSVHAIMLLDVAPKIAEKFKTDPSVAEFLDPAVLVNADEDGCVASIVERLQLTEMMSAAELTSGEPVGHESPDGAPIAVLVMDKSGATVYRVPDPRMDPQCWPWMGLEDDEDED
jgi:hypothetical protein